MIIEYDDEDRCIRVNGEYVAIREAEGLKDELELAIDQWEVDHAEQCEPRRTLRRLNQGRRPDRRIEAARLARALTMKIL